jgi:hypothetical protein
MKFTFKKVASVLASAVMLTSTVGFAAAASYPNPFTSQGAAVVYGAAAAQTDVSAAIDISNQLKELAEGSQNVDVTGEAVAVETSSQPLYLGDKMNTTKETFSKDQLPTVLADDTITDDDGKEYDVQLRIVSPNTSIIYGDTPDNLAEPVLYANFNDADFKYSLRITFPTAVNISKLTDEAIRLFGKDYTFTGSVTSLTENKIVLFEKATSVRINDGESVTSEGHTITVAVEDTNTASITIDGVSESKDEGWSGKIGAVDVYIKNVVGPNVAGSSRYVDLYLNSNKLTLEHGQDVVLGSEDVDGAAVQFTNASGKVSQIDIDISPHSLDGSIEYLELGDEMLDPVFGSVKLALASVTPGLESEDRDYLLIKPSAEKKVRVKFTNKAGKEYDMDMLRPSPIALNSTYDAMYNSTHIDNGTHFSSNTWTYNATELGVGDDYELITTTSGAINESDYVITCSNEYTQIWELEKIDVTGGDQYVELKDQGSDTASSTKVTLTGTAAGSTGTLTLADGSSTTVALINAGAINISGACDHIYTKNGALIDLRTADAPTSNLSEIRLFEETAYNGGTFKDNAATTLGKNITVRMAYDKAGRSGNDIFIRDTMSGTTDGTEDTDYWKDDVGDYDKYYVTKYGTYVKQTGDSDKQVEMYYPEDAMSIGFYIGEESSMVIPGDTGSGGQIEIVNDNEISSVSSKHLIVVGGSCINKVALKILDASATEPICGEDFSELTSVGAGGYIIKTVESPYSSDKRAMLVAGYNAEDTVKAVEAAKVIGGVSTDVGSVKTYPVVAGEE